MPVSSVVRLVVAGERVVLDGNPDGIGRPAQPYDHFLRSRFVEHENGCWLWTGTVDREGYGVAKRAGKRHRAHRLVYEYLVGRIPKGLTLDHLCRVRHCVNPQHLEPVDSRTNVLRGIGISAANSRKTHCKRGHQFDEPNTYWYRGERVCRACSRDNQRRKRAR